MPAKLSSEVITTYVKRITKPSNAAVVQAVIGSLVPKHSYADQAWSRMMAVDALYRLYRVPKDELPEDVRAILYPEPAPTGFVPHGPTGFIPFDLEEERTQRQSDLAQVAEAQRALKEKLAQSPESERGRCQDE